MGYFTNKTVLITGGAGFIGYHLAKKVLNETPARVVIIDNLNDYYMLQLKYDRLKLLGINADDPESYKSKRLVFYRANIADIAAVKAIFDQNEIDVVAHLAAQAGVRYAKENPRAYIESNIDGFFNILQQAASHNVSLCLYASSSSVYGGNTPIPFKEDNNNFAPLSFYAATKLSGEFIAQTYSQTSSLPCVGLRFFNVYGPWGRPDMAYFSWAMALRDKQPITIHGEGKMLRDMT